MNIVQLVFSPTGGTKRAADLLSKELGDTIRMIDLTDAALQSTDLDDNDLAVIAVPSFGGRVPALAAQRIAKIHGNQARCVVMCVYGNRAYEDTLVELEDLARQSGFQVIAAVTAVAEHSIMHQYAAGRPDQQDQEELKGYGSRILEKISEGACSPVGTLPGNRPYKKSGGVGMVPKAGKNCTGCGLCAKSCPAQAIRMDNIKTADSKLCISCMRCVTRCPQSARKVNGAMVAAASLAMKKVCSVRKGNELYL
ncbi:MAG: 4Fe-4S binding protein [Oscillospiraceae bacterium]|nr:4Fe-4S binding protein [Oscillospiraceae bacterium]